MKVLQTTKRWGTSSPNSLKLRVLACQDSELVLRGADASSYHAGIHVVCKLVWIGVFLRLPCLFIHAFFLLMSIISVFDSGWNLPVQGRTSLFRAESPCSRFVVVRGPRSTCCRGWWTVGNVSLHIRMRLENVGSKRAVWR